MGLIYLDTCLVVYLVEKPSPLFERTQLAIWEHPSPTICVSPLVKAECLVGPMKRNDGELEAQFEDFFQTAKTLDIDEAVFRRAAKLRAELGFKLPDALHVACAAHHGCDSFWTNDARLSRVANYIDIKIVG